MTTILFENALVLALGEADRIFDPGFVLIEDGRIAASGQAGHVARQLSSTSVSIVPARSSCPVSSMPIPTRP